MISLYIAQNFANRSYLEALVDILNATTYRDLGLQFAANYFKILTIQLKTCACGL